MKVTNILINQMTHPLGFDLSALRITFEVSGVQNRKDEIAYKSLKIYRDSNDLVYYSPKQKYEDNSFQVNACLEPRKRYFVEVSFEVEDQKATGRTWFETGKINEPLFAVWIANKDKAIENTLFKKNFSLGSKKIKRARLYCTALGVYEAYLNNKKIGDEFLAPGFTNYDKLIQLQTYDVTRLLTENGQNKLIFSVGNGWYKGNLGFDGGQSNIYGDQQAVLAELHINFIDDSEIIINTDNSWLTEKGLITKSSIYYGEDIDDNLHDLAWKPVEILNKATNNISDRLSLPIKKKQILKVKKIIQTPQNEIVLDFGQNHAGWPVFINNLPKGTKITLQMGETLQSGNFYNRNLRLARAAFTYISDGKKKIIRPHFTYFGYRYIKVSGVNKVNKDDFESWVLYSDLQSTGYIKTNNEKVNRLFDNVIWSQRSNFMDIPTDCPQRDERLGWTGDAEIFAPTASFNMNTFEFYKKFSKDMLVEQKNNNGKLPIVVPSLNQIKDAMAIWSDAATIIPWTTYIFYGDIGVLKQNYSQMKKWVDWITANTDKKYLWTGQMQLGDWLSLDNGDSPKGKTDSDYIASIYYYVSADIVSRAARLLHHERDAEYYNNLSRNIKANILKEYITSNGRVAIDTQTALVLAIQFNLVLDNQKSHVVNDLVKKVKKDNKHLTTGFVGTPLLLPALSANNQHRLAMDIFMQEDCPSWLYEVNHGATTIWERWNSILPDGKMNPEGMNSLNHYSLGAVMMWGYQYLVGFKEFDAGFKEIVFAPKFDYRLKDVYSEFYTSYGKIKVEYHIESNENHLIQIKLDIPFGIKMKIIFPRMRECIINQKKANEKNIYLTNGHYNIEYIPMKSFLNYFSLSSKVSDILSNKELVNTIDKVNINILKKMKKPGNTQSIFINKSINELLDFENVSKQEVSQIKAILRKTILV